MIDPLTAVGTHAASKIVERLLNAAMPASSTHAPSKATSQTHQSQQVTDIQEIIGKDLQKFLDQNPQIKEALGEGPYLLKQEGSSLTLSGSEGKDITVSANSHFGQKALLLSQWNNSKFFEKGLELKAI